MYISIKDGEEEITLSNENLDNDAFVEIGLDMKTAIVPLDELMSAVIAFESKRSRRLSEEALFDK